MKRFLAVFLMLAILLASLSVTAMAAEPDGWKKETGGWQYIQGGKPVANKWIQDGGYWYYIGTDTYMVTDDLVFSFDQYDQVDCIYYMQANGRLLVSGWHELRAELEIEGEKIESSVWFYAKANGKLAMNEWARVSGKWFYFSGIAMVANGVYEIDGKYYWFRTNGEMVVGWYQFHKSEYGGEASWVYAKENGQLVTGWQLINKKWYYFGESEDWGYLVQNCIFGIKVEDKEEWDIYVAGKDGAIFTSCWYEDIWTNYEDGITCSDWYYLTDSGRAQKGWLNQSGKWYYMDPEWGYMWKGWVSVNGINYHLDEKSGVMTVGWFRSDDAWYYFRNSGAMARNEWLQINGKWYYFDDDGQMLANGTYTFKDSKQYTFDVNGVWVK